MKHRVVITGMGVVAPNAVGLDNFLDLRSNSARKVWNYISSKTTRLKIFLLYWRNSSCFRRDQK